MGRIEEHVPYPPGEDPYLGVGWAADADSV